MSMTRVCTTFTHMACINTDFTCLQAGMKLVKMVGGEVVEAACIIELPELKGRDRLQGLPLFVLLALEEQPVPQ